jgi:transcription antitermination factor NusG
VAAGQRVRVISGPFKGIQGIVMRVKGSTRVVIALSEIAQAISVEVQPEFLDAI